MKVRVTGTKAQPIVDGLGHKENDQAFRIHGAKITGQEPLPLYATYSIITGEETLVDLPAGGAKCTVLAGHQIAKITRGEPTRVYDMDRDHNPNRHFACGDHYDALRTLDQLEAQLRANRFNIYFVATDIETDAILFKKPEESNA